MKRYGPYVSNFGHLFVVEVEDDGSRRSVWLHREVMEKKLGRKLKKHEIVHHDDENPANNRPGNLKITSTKAHNELHLSVPSVQLACARCKIQFERRGRKERWRKSCKKAGPFCSKSCAGSWSRMKQIQSGMSNLRA